MIERAVRVRARPARARRRVAVVARAGRLAAPLRAAHRFVVRRRSACAARSAWPSVSALERPEWELAAGRLAYTIANREDAFEPKEPWAMDWYYPVLCGAVDRRRGPRPSGRALARVHPRRPRRALRVGPAWITAAETAECSLAHLAVGERNKAVWLLDRTAACATETAPTGPASRSGRSALPGRRALVVHRRRGRPRRRRAQRRVARLGHLRRRRHTSRLRASPAPRRTTAWSAGSRS